MNVGCPSPSSSLLVGLVCFCRTKSWYRKYSDGWIEQGGQFEFSVGYNATVAKTFPLASRFGTGLSKGLKALDSLTLKARDSTRA